jgi:hypothetical protein
VDNFLSKIKDLNLAVDLIRLGARAPVVKRFCPTVSRETLHGLTWEITGRAAKKGQLPYSEEWFYPYPANCHTMLFLSFYDREKTKGAYRIANAFKKYYNHSRAHGHAPLFHFNRAVILLDLLSADILQKDICEKCNNEYIRATAMNICPHCNKPHKSKEIDFL